MRQKVFSFLSFKLLAFCISVAGEHSIVKASSGESITLHFTGMNPHVGQTFYLRAVDKGTLRENFGTGFIITDPDFDMILPVTEGKSYFLDFFADVNGNSLYDTPPTDHAWRIDANDVTNGQELNFSHNTNFTDIDWSYIVVVNFTGMTPHIGQMFEIRLEDDNTGKEVERI